jgi:signal transduction histidine kinase
MADENNKNPIEISVTSVKVGEELYIDAVKHLAKRIGNVVDTLGGVVEMLLFPFTERVYQFDQNKKQFLFELNQKLKNTPNGNLQNPPAHLAIPVLQKLVYTDDERLREMFVNLIANSMDKTTEDKAHPSFVEIISQINPDEAKLLEYLSTQEFFPYVNFFSYLTEL